MFPGVKKSFKKGSKRKEVREKENKNISRIKIIFHDEERLGFDIFLHFYIFIMKENTKRSKEKMEDLFNILNKVNRL